MPFPPKIKKGILLLLVRPIQAFGAVLESMFRGKVVTVAKLQQRNCLVQKLGLK